MMRVSAPYVRIVAILTKHNKLKTDVTTLNFYLFTYDDDIMMMPMGQSTVRDRDR